jgi:hypothetical protein
VDAQVNIAAGAPGAPPPAAGAAATNTAGAPVLSNEELMARIRPMVMEILEQELTRFQRQQG